MKLRTLTKVFIFLVGVCIALLGVTWVFVAASGAVKTDPVAGYVAGAGFLLAAAPLLAFPFSVGVAKSLLVLVMFVLAFGMLWFAFQPNSPASHPALVQVAAIAFAVMLLARVVLVLRRKRSALGT
ncbi:hypothetical protein [Rhodanobacter sp. C03]|uniref:hypothetical protein n=1 Tax=Rhodanobacter sp. C03 TaxID=1945858 RepID=UPI001115A172|nr:hypothetical protein [Rhodanobacter sp. C03]